MYALFLAVALSTTPLIPPESPPSMVISQAVETPANRTIQLRHLRLIQLAPTPSPEMEMIREHVPYGQELNDLNDWYQRYRADKRWQNGIGVTFALGRERHRWTISLGPIQFVFGGQHSPPVP